MLIQFLFFSENPHKTMNIFFSKWITGTVSMSEQAFGTKQRPKIGHI